MTTCGRFWFSCLCKESLSFSKSFTLPSRSPVFSCSFFRLSTSLSLSSSMDTINCSKLASSPNWEDRCEIESSEMVGITSHIMFHMATLGSVRKANQGAIWTSWHSWTVCARLNCSHFARPPTHRACPSLPATEAKRNSESGSRRAGWASRTDSRAWLHFFLVSRSQVGSL